MFHCLPSSPAQDSALEWSYRLSFCDDTCHSALPSLSTTAFHAALHDLQLTRQASTLDQELIVSLTDSLASTTDQLQCLHHGLHGSSRRLLGKRGILVDHRWSPAKLRMLRLPTAAAVQQHGLADLQRLFMQRERMRSEAASRSELQLAQLSQHAKQLHEQQACERAAARSAAREAAALRRQLLALKAEHKQLQQQSQQLGLARLVQEMQITQLTAVLAEAHSQLEGMPALEAQLCELQRDLSGRQQAQEQELAQLRQQLSSIRTEQAWKDKVSYSNIQHWSSSVLQGAAPKKSLLSVKLAEHQQVRLNSSAPDAVGTGRQLLQQSAAAERDQAPHALHAQPCPHHPTKLMHSNLSADPIDAATAQALEQPGWALAGISDDTVTRCPVKEMRI